MSDITTQIIISIFSGLLFLISEALPFINIKSNGIVHLIVNLIKSTNNSLQQTQTLQEEEPLLNNTNDTIIHINQHSPFDAICNNLNNLNNSLINSTSELINNSKQLKLQTSELYELNYIINYIKVNYPKKLYKTKFLTKSNKQLLISQGYIVDYDSEQDNYMIKW